MSASFNKVMLMGNLTRDVQVKMLPSNTTVAEFGLAVSRKFKTQAGEDREEVAFVDCAAFGKQAEVISQYCTKGKPSSLRAG
jgi:single-strand DNA-binding protein